jgi:hypothetical protein
MVLQSERGRVCLHMPRDAGDTRDLVATNVGEIYLWEKSNNSERQSYQIQEQGSGYVFYSVFAPGSWLGLNEKTGEVVAVPRLSDAVVWNLVPRPAPELLQGTVP